METIKKVLKIDEGRLIEINDLNDIKTILDDENYIIQNDDYILVDLDKNQVKYYVKYLIKGMEGSRELGSIIFNRYILFITLLFIFVILFMINNVNNSIDKLPKQEVVKTGILPVIKVGNKNLPGNTNTGIIKK